MSPIKRRNRASGGADRVMPFAAWCALTGLSLATAKWLIAAGDGPRTVRQNARRVGISPSEHAPWLVQRTGAR